jgi:flagellar hook assembly protein FlgD
VPWDGTDERGNDVASGVYFVRLEAGADRASRKVVLLK